MYIEPLSPSLDGLHAFQNLQNPWLQAKVDAIREKTFRQYNPKTYIDIDELEGLTPKATASEKEAEKKKPSTFELFSTALPTQVSNIRPAPPSPKVSTAPKQTSFKKRSLPVLPNVPDEKATFLSPDLDPLRSFRSRPYPWAQTAVSTDAMALRDQKFKRYNARSSKKNPPYSPHCLDHKMEAAKSGTFDAHVVSVEEEGFKAWVKGEFESDRKWVDGFLVAVAGLYWTPIVPMLAFLFRGMVAPALLFLTLLLWLII
jgi:hypothetical protein